MSLYKNTYPSKEEIRQTTSDVNYLKIFSIDDSQYLTWLEQNMNYVNQSKIESSLYISVNNSGDFKEAREIVKIEGTIIEYKVLVSKGNLYIVCISRNKRDEDILILLDSDNYGRTFAECRRIKLDGKIKELLFDLTNEKPYIYCSISSNYNKTLSRISCYTWIPPD
jgi:hypothetical protein